MVRNVPKLRFKEFSGEWEEKKLGKIGEFKKTYSFSRNLEGNGNYKHIHYGDIHMKYNGVISSKKIIPSIDIPNDNYVFIQEKDIIFADASEDRKDLGKVAIVKDIEKNVLSGLHTLCFTPTNELNSEFFLYHTLNNNYLEFMYTRGNGAKVLGISKSNLLEYKFLIPSLQEQEKIASFISLIDDKINLQSEKVKYLKDYKKGLMQKIFSRKLRFKDENGNDYPEWEEKRVYELGDIITGNTPSKDNLDYYDISNNEKFIWIIPTDITENKNIYEGATSLSKKGYEMTRKLPPNTVLVTCIASIGKNTILKVYGSCNQQINAIIVNDENNYEFIYYLIEHNTELLKRFAGITATPILNKTDFSNLEFLVPKIEEQEKISNILSKIDLKIEKEQERLYLFNEYKKGLLQQMFV